MRRTVAALCAAITVTLTTLTTAAPAHAAPRVGDWITADDGVSCRYGYPYINGAGPRPGYTFDSQCRPVTTL